MTRAVRKPSPIDLYEAEQIARATHYTAHLRESPAVKHTIRCDTIEQARIAAASLNAEHGGYGRRATLYAVTPEGVAFHVR